MEREDIKRNLSNQIKTSQKIIPADATELNIKIQELLNIVSDFKVKRDPEVSRKAYLA